jgi:hypothetical protein
LGFVFWQFYALTIIKAQRYPLRQFRVNAEQEGYGRAFNGRRGGRRRFAYSPKSGPFRLDG